MLFKQRAEEEFNIEVIGSEQMDAWVGACVEMYKGNPCWIDEQDNIDSINFAKAVCSEVARLATLGIGIHVDGSARAAWIQKQIDSIFYQLRHWVEYGCAYGTIILKPNGDTVELYTPENFAITNTKNSTVKGAVFLNSQKQGKKWYTRMEYHRFEGDTYHVTNKCFVGDSQNDMQKSVDITKTPWSDLLEDVAIANADRPLFAVFRTPQANNIDLASPLGLPIFSEAVQELRDLDIAYSRNSKEIMDSKRTVLLDSDRLLPNPDMLRNENALGHVRMPDYIKLVDGDTSVESDIYHEINPSLNTDNRLAGINALLSQIGYKVGFSNGYFVFNEATGIQTATGVEAEQQRTVQFIKDVRDKLENCLNDLAYSLNFFADLYNLAPAGKYEIVCDFGDIAYSYEEDKQTWYKYAAAGKIPFWYYLVKFEGLTEDEAKKLEQEAKPKTPVLFGGEE